ncbi:hypothetical protein [Entomomonas asaccharolytica]|uniref:Uncharacterized protein n=1 Tax=Entomomonas asaccharolytica TaxID=2785331 RepID=A0A974NF65_9GAMM|nr:hypothetical protein [Entomomonas asaccharolytica]QQP85418.1 hypothetical protein JHT90_13720 [Entomomonas asaccharolytica]
MNHKQISIRGCILCIGNGVEDDTFTNPNKNVGEINHYIFPILGSGSVSNGQKSLLLEEGKLTDLTAFVGNEINYQVAKESEWVAFNSLLERTMNVQIITETPTNLYKNDLEETIFVALKGEVTINEKSLLPFKSGRLFKSNKATIILNENSILAAITFKE